MNQHNHQNDIMDVKYEQILQIRHENNLSVTTNIFGTSTGLICGTVHPLLEQLHHGRFLSLGSKKFTARFNNENLTQQQDKIGKYQQSFKSLTLGQRTIILINYAIRITQYNHFSETGVSHNQPKCEILWSFRTLRIV